MAKAIKAISALGPRISLGKKASMNELVSAVANRTGLNKGDVLLSVNELRDNIVSIGLSGRGVKIDGLGTFTPKINLKGQISLSVRLDSSISADLNKRKAFEGNIENREMMGKTVQDIIAKWNELHPDDLVD
ncbi:MAG: HU family DNA-binding protein [Candidatus Aminicenantes bacterium]|nr:HU family DNA-binding protein [Candidatus Aminicenantes bacterium]